MLACRCTGSSALAGDLKSLAPYVGLNFKNYNFNFKVKFILNPASLSFLLESGQT